MLVYKTYIIVNNERVWVWGASVSNENVDDLADFYSWFEENGFLLYKQNGVTYIGSRNKQGQCVDADITGLFKLFASTHNLNIQVRILRDDAPGSVSFQAKKIW